MLYPFFFCIATFSYISVVLLQPFLCDGCWAISPHIDHEVWGEVEHSVGPPPGQVQHLARRHLKGHWGRLRVERILLQIWLQLGGIENCTPLQRTFGLCVVEIFVILWGEYCPFFLSDDLIDEVIFAVDMSLCESA